MPNKVCRHEKRGGLSCVICRDIEIRRLKRQSKNKNLQAICLLIDQLVVEQSKAVEQGRLFAVIVSQDIKILMTMCQHYNRDDS